MTPQQKQAWIDRQLTKAPPVPAQAGRVIASVLTKRDDDGKPAA